MPFVVWPCLRAIDVTPHRVDLFARLHGTQNFGTTYVTGMYSNIASGQLLSDARIEKPVCISYYAYPHYGTTLRELALLIRLASYSARNAESMARLSST
ncbi:hypothetical protein HH1059_08290 [Halorhodospira halochloris]|uniref:Uncharacterized protein n=1 Tax=Halorhodospira halochloris TaxID=1052 RepID=A0A2Z6EZR3_HALHR|nr:hypothetical protein HH1059_08290 [Halorhodospira halochloris]